MLLLDAGSMNTADVELCRLPDGMIRELPPRDDGFEVLARGVFPRLGVPALLWGRERTAECFCPRECGPSEL